VEALDRLPRGLAGTYVFRNPATGKPWAEIRKAFRKAAREAKLENLWVHDLRRSFVTNARKAGNPESVVMKLSGHKTASVFARYNIVSEEDLRQAVSRLQQQSTQVGKGLAIQLGKTTPETPRGSAEVHGTP
jgi:integrase